MAGKCGAEADHPAPHPGGATPPAPGPPPLRPFFRPPCGQGQKTIRASLFVRDPSAARDCILESVFHKTPTYTSETSLNTTLHLLSHA